MLLNQSIYCMIHHSLVRKYIPKRGNIFQKEEIHSKKMKYIPKRGNIFQKMKIYIPKRMKIYIPKRWNIFQTEEIYSKKGNAFKIFLNCWHCDALLVFGENVFLLQLLTNNFLQTWQIRLHFSYLCVMGGGKNLGTKPAPSQGL